MTEEEWVEKMLKRGYYCTELSKQIRELPTEKARQIKANLETNNHRPFDERAKEFVSIPEIARMMLLMNKLCENVCCPQCMVSGFVAAFLIQKLDEEVPSSTLH